MNENTLKHSATACRWTARVLGGLFALTMLIIAIGEGVPNPFTQPVRVQVGLLALGLIVTGLLGGWRWELPGGIVSLVGWIVFVLSVMPAAKPLNGFVLALALPGVLYIGASLLRRRSQPLTG